MKFPCLQIIFKIIISFMFSCFILNIFILFYKYNGARIFNQDYTTDFKWSSYQLFTNMEEGFSFLKFDKDGFNNIEYNNNKVDILLMGNSNMEACNVDSCENTGYYLNYILYPLKTQNIGISAHYLIYCLRNLLYAYKFYHSKYILIETKDIEFDILLLKQYLNGNLKRNRAYKKGSKEVFFQNIFPSMKKIITQLSSWANNSKNIFDNNSKYTNCNVNKKEY